jgi:hypothetical protein
MSTEREQNPSASDAESDFSVPGDADYTTPGDPMDEDRHPEEPRTEENGLNATPGNPLED